MTDDRLSDRMQEVLDGTATPADAAALRSLVARDADAAEEFATWTATFDGLSTLPMVHPPEGLVAAIDAALPASIGDARPVLFSKTDQLFDDGPVFGEGRTQARRPFGFKTISSWLVPASSRESNVNIQQKYLAGGAAAVVALGIAAVLAGYPPKSNDVVGTVVPAERYRAPQTGAEAVKLGEQAPAASTAIASDATGPAAANVEAAEAASRVAYLAQAEKFGQLSQADRAAYLSQAEKISKLSEADRAAYLSQAGKAFKAGEADRAAFQSQADRAAFQSQADRAAFQSQAGKAFKADEADRAVASQSQAGRAFKADEADRAVASQSQAGKAFKAGEADRAANRQDQADKAVADKRF